MTPMFLKQLCLVDMYIVRSMCRPRKWLPGRLNHKHSMMRSTQLTRHDANNCTNIIQNNYYVTDGVTSCHNMHSNDSCINHCLWLNTQRILWLLYVFWRIFFYFYLFLHFGSFCILQWIQKLTYCILTYCFIWQFLSSLFESILDIIDKILSLNWHDKWTPREPSSMLNPRVISNLPVP